MSDLLTKLATFAKRHNREIFMGLAIAGTVATAVSAASDTFTAKKKLDEAMEEGLADKENRAVETVKIVAPCYVSTALIAGTTIFSIYGLYQTSSMKIKSYATACALATNTAQLYKDKVREILNAKKVEAIDDAVAKKQLEKSGDKGSEVLIGDGEVLCFDGFSGRYFKSTMEKVRRAENDVNYVLNSEMYVSLNTFYDQIGLAPIGAGDDIGWSSEYKVELSFSSQITNDGRPCLVINFKNSPSPSFANLH